MADHTSSNVNRREMLRLAAYLGDSTSRQALGTTEAEQPQDLDNMIRGLETWGKEACVRAGVSLLHTCLSELKADPATSESFTSAIQSMTAWIDRPCDDHQRAARKTGDTIEDGMMRGSLGTIVQVAIWSSWGAGGEPSRINSDDGGSIRAACVWTARAASGALRHGVSESRISQAIRETLIPWALSHHDPR